MKKKYYEQKRREAVTKDLLLEQSIRSKVPGLKQGAPTNAANVKYTGGGFALK